MVGLFVLGGLALVVGLVGLCALFSMFFTTQQNHVRFVLRFGELKKVARAGLGRKAPFIDTASEPFSLQTRQEDISEVTLDSQDVPVHIKVSVLYRATEERAADAFFKLSNPVSQIKAHVSNAVRAQVRSMALAEVMRNRDAIGTAVKNELKETVEKEYGWTIESVLVPHAQPDQSILEAMNRKVASEQAKVTAVNEAEAAYQRRVREAQAAAKEMELHGQGLGAQRLAVINSAKEAVETLKTVGIDPKEASHMVTVLQWMDMQRDLADKGQAKVIFTNTHPGSMSEIERSLQQASMVAHESASVAPAAK